MTIKILDLSYRSRVSKGSFKVPYLIVNCVLKIDRHDDCMKSYYYDSAMAATEEYKKVIVTGSPEEEEKKFKEKYDFAIDMDESEGLEELIKAIESEPPPEQVWTYAESYLTHIKKFDCFWFREWIADCNVTRYILQELREFQKIGRAHV